MTAQLAHPVSPRQAGVLPGALAPSPGHALRLRFAPRTNAEPIGERVRAECAGMPVRDIAHLLGVDTRNVERCFAGRIPVSAALRLCEARGLSIDWLLLGREPRLIDTTIPHFIAESSLPEIAAELGRRIRSLRRREALAETQLHTLCARMRL